MPLRLNGGDSGNARSKTVIPTRFSQRLMTGLEAMAAQAFRPGKTCPVVAEDEIRREQCFRNDTHEHSRLH